MTSETGTECTQKINISVFNECVCESRSVVSDSLRPRVLYSPWNSPGQNTGVGSHSLLQVIEYGFLQFL